MRSTPSDAPPLAAVDRPAGSDAVTGDRGTNSYALLDDAGASAARPTSRLYQRFVREHRCRDPAQLAALWADVDADLRAGLHAVLLVDYEWGAKLLRAGHERLAPDDAAALRVLMFGDLQHLSQTDATAWLDARDDADDAAGTMNLHASVDRADFIAAIDRIHAAIAAGETYQVNYTYRLEGAAYGAPVALYRRLRARQPVAYGALIALPDGTQVLSCSPELFIEHHAGVLTARPMKGTAARIPGPEGDSETARHLAIDIKNRAENLMIVDLLRNDLGRLAQTGSVQVPALFAIEPYSTVFQMTSTVQARLRPEVDFPAMLRAAFPCGSITGAPKHHTMELIEALETTPRGLYCGAIGWLDQPPPDQRCPDFCLSVAIRTLTLGRVDAHGLRAARLGVGAGIVADSRADDEFEECLWKARFLTGLDPGFALFETMRVQVPEVPLLAHHLGRLAHSAHTLGFAFDRAVCARRVRAHAATLAPVGAVWRLRLALAHDGRLDLRAAPLEELSEGEVTLCIADTPLPVVNPLAAHKTTLRALYDEGVRAAQRVGAFDSLFFRADGRLVEGGRSSVFVRREGRWVTPPLADGALPGVMRRCLLTDPGWAATERTLTRDDVERAEAIVVCNALRGALPARLRVAQPS